MNLSIRKSYNKRAVFHTSFAIRRKRNFFENSSMSNDKLCELELAGNELLLFSMN